MFRLMEKNGTFSPSTVILFLFLVVFLAPDLAQGAMYKYTDKNGTVIFTDCYECIPKPYRDQVEKMKIREEPPAPTPPETKQKGATPEIQGGGPTSKPEPGKSVEASGESDREKESRDKKLQASREKEARIQELRTRLEAAQREKAGLRTNWMVFDRIRTNQLNQEIENLQKEIQALQAEEKE